MKKHYRIRVSGRVQGVFFRASTRDKARELGVSGWVKNEEGNSVLISAEGTEEALRSLLDWCKKGSPLAKVNSVNYQEKALESHSGFVIIS